MKRCFGRRADRVTGDRDVGKHTAGVQDGCLGFGLQMFDQGRRHADRSEQVGGDQVLRDGIVNRA